MHWYRYEEAIERAEALTEGDIGIYGLNYVNLMLYKEMPPYTYMEQAVYSGDLAFRRVQSIGRYYFDEMPEDRAENMVFVYPYLMEETFREAGYVTEHVTECYGVAYR